MNIARTRASLAVGSLFAFGVVSAQQPATELSPVVVTANPVGSSLFDLAAPASVLEGPRLRARAQSTLGETLGGEAGVTSSYFGPNASRPVIRGLDGDRIRILQNGVGVIDASSVSVDHAVSVEPLLIDRAEVVRGPATLMYGGNAVGGVVNVVDGRIPQERLTGAAGALEARYGTAAGENAQAARLDLGNGQLMLHADVSRRRSGDIRIPDFARSARLRARDPRPLEEEARGRLPNSAAESEGGALGASAVWDRGYTGIAYSQYDTRYGTVAEPDVRIGLQQRRYELAGEVRRLGPFIEAIRYKSAYSDYRHIEYEGTDPGTQFDSNGHNSRIELLHAPLGRMKGAIGIEVTNFKLKTIGEEAFLPNTRTSSTEAFVYEEASFGALKLSGGFRAGRTEAQASDDARFEGTETRKFAPRSSALGAVWSLGPQYAIAMQGSLNERAPTYQELFANGPHIATGVVEIGDTTLRKEKSRAIDLSFRKRTGALTGSVGAFVNRFDNYIALLDSGEIDPDEGLPVYNFRQVRAEFRGLELDAQWRLVGAGGARWTFEARADRVRATNRDSGEPLPRIAPARFGGAVNWESGRWSARLDVLHALAQDRVAAAELPTDAYTMVNATIAHRMRVGATTIELFARGVNLLDEDARLHSSFLKDIAPLARRGAVVGVRGTF